MIETEEKLLGEAVRVREGSCLAFIGAGGKTTTMFALADEAQVRGLRVLCTTTTKIWPPSGRALILGEQEGTATLKSSVRRHHLAVLGDRIGPDGKLWGITSEQLCRLHGERVADVVLCEADGAAGRLLKVHGTGEPVIPECVTTVLILCSLQAVGRRVDQESIHRLEPFCRLTGACVGDRIEPRHVALALAAASRFAPPGASTIFVLAQGDTADAVNSAHQIAVMLAQLVDRPRIVLSRLGEYLVTSALSADHEKT